MIPPDFKAPEIGPDRTEALAALLAIIKPKAEENARAKAEGKRKGRAPGGDGAAAGGRMHVPTDLDDDALLTKARNAKGRSGQEFSALYDRGDTSGFPSPSEADFSLLVRLAFWTRHDPDRMERLFDQSALGRRGKWRDRPDYREMSISNAIDAQDKAYDPDHGGGKKRTARVKSARATAAANGPMNGQHGTDGASSGHPHDGTNTEPEPPTIVIRTQLHEVIDEAVASLTDEPAVYQRCNMLMTVLRDVAKRKKRDIRRPAGTPRIAPLPLPRLRELMAKDAEWVKPIEDNLGNKEYVLAHPPDWAVSGVAARGEWEDIRPIEGVIEAPTIREDGSLLDTPGWDEATGLLYQPNAAFDPIPDQPTKAEAEEAAETLLEIVADFPFAEITDKDGNNGDGGRTNRAAWLASLLTVMARPAIDGPTPLFLFDSNVAGSGKSKLCDIIAIVTTGREMARADYPDKEEEMAKTLLSIALAADPMTLFDNVPNGFSIGGKSLDRALTARTVKGRILGRSEMTPDLSLPTVFFATGNNLGMRGDALRRVIPGRLESAMERPEEREDFRIEGDILAHVRQERGRLVAAALTILRGYIVAGRPRPEPKLTPMDYPAWCGLIRNAVHWATGTDPCGGRQQLRENDPESNARAALVEGWSELPGGRSKIGVPIAEALRILKDSDNENCFTKLRDALMEMSRTADLPGAVVIGNRLKAIKDRTIEGMTLRCKPYQGTQFWRVEGERKSKPDDERRGAGGAGGADSRPRAENARNQDPNEGGQGPNGDFASSDAKQPHEPHQPHENGRRRDWRRDDIAVFLAFYLSPYPLPFSTVRRAIIDAGLLPNPDDHKPIFRAAEMLNIRRDKETIPGQTLWSLDAPPVVGVVNEGVGERIDEIRDMAQAAQPAY